LGEEHRYSSIIDPVKTDKLAPVRAGIRLPLTHSPAAADAIGTDSASIFLNETQKCFHVYSSSIFSLTAMMVFSVRYST
jgi:hypothetical protein